MFNTCFKTIIALKLFNSAFRGLPNLQQLYVSGGFCGGKQKCTGSNWVQLVCLQTLQTFQVDRLLSNVEGLPRNAEWLACCNNVAIATSSFGRMSTACGDNGCLREKV